MKKMFQEVLDFFKSRPKHSYKTKDVARGIEVPRHLYANLRDALRQLARDGQLVKYKHNRYGLASESAEVIGKLHVNSQGYGFVSHDGGEDIFISQKNMHQALHNDVVQVRLFADTRGKSPEGMIVKVVERVCKKIVGTFMHGKHYNYVIPDDLKINRDVTIAHGEEKGAVDGDKVVVTIDTWEHKKLNPAGTILEVLGPPEKVGVDILSLVHQYNLETEFSEKLEKDVERINDALPKKEVARRLDMRNETIITIDPDDAKDFDDAISLKKLDNGNWYLGVHIADVSYYVHEKSDLDKEARERGTSVYLVDRVIPMLPERISNHLCSLVEGRDRFCYSVFVELKPNGEPVKYNIAETVIHSKKRLTYRQAQDIIDGKLNSDLTVMLQDMHTLHKALVRKRAQRGGVDFDSLEVKIELDADGNPVNIVRREQLDTNRMIEEFMLLANQTVAKHVGVHLTGEGHPLPFVYRIHDKPSADKMTELFNTARAFGVSIKPPKRVTPHYFQSVSKAFNLNAASSVLQDSLIRSMMKAKYSTENVGHFGLAYKFYTHFTSPIRRYPDLLVHRLLKHYAEDLKSPINRKELQKLCDEASESESRAQEAERASIKLKQTEFMERHLGETFDGIIVRMVPFGFFVEIPELLVDGLVHVKTMDDYYVLDEKKFTFTGKSKGKTYKLGDQVRIEVSYVDRNERIIDFTLV